MAIPRTVGLPLVLCGVVSSLAMNADAQFRVQQKRSGEEILKNLSHVQAELPRGPQGPARAAAFRRLTKEFIERSLC